MTQKVPAVSDEKKQTFFDSPEGKACMQKVHERNDLSFDKAIRQVNENKVKLP